MRLMQILKLPDTLDPDDRRRRQILNTILMFFIVAGIFCFLATFAFGDSFLEVVRDPDALLILIASSFLVVTFSLLVMLNRWERAGSLAAWLFIVSLIGIIWASDSPTALISNGLISWTLPILAAGMVLQPRTAFLVAAVISLINRYILVILLHQFINPYATAAFFVLAFLTWLGMSIANSAIRTARLEAQKNAAILNGVADGVVVLDEHDQVVLANPVALSLMGSGLAALTAVQTQQQELRGRVLAFEWSHVNGVGKVAIVRDISRQVEIERAKDAMLGVVSHEMRTPLAAIIGFAEMIALRSDAVSEMANRIQTNAQRLIHMVDDLLDHAQAQAGVLKIHSEPVSLSALMESVTKLVSGLAAEKRLQFKTELAPDLPDAVMSDGGRLQQILVNLIGNAIKFTEEGEIGASFRKTDEGWAMVVRDTGIGIPEERLPDIFEPFRRGSDYATRRHQGAGLGLSIVKTLVNLMDGRVEVESSMGKGSVFTVILPLKKVNS